MDSLAQYARQILSLIVVFSLLGFTVWKLRHGRGNFSLARLGKTFSPKSFLTRARSGERALETVERLTLTPQHALHVLRWRGREMLVATHPQGCTLLDRPLDERVERSAGLARGSSA